MKVTKRNKNICICFSEDEAIVFFEWLTRFNENDGHEFHHQSEKRVLWDLEATLETCDINILEADYKSKLLAARDRVKDQ